MVWFGEMPFEMERIYEALAAAALFVSIGTSGSVYPAAGFVEQARQIQHRLDVRDAVAGVASSDPGQREEESSPAVPPVGSVST